MLYTCLVLIKRVAVWHFSYVFFKFFLQVYSCTPLMYMWLWW